MVKYIFILNKFLQFASEKLYRPKYELYISKIWL